MRVKVICPIEGCGRTFKARGKSAHWRNLHTWEMTYEEYKRLVGEQGAAQDGGRPTQKSSSPAREPPLPDLDSLQTVEELFYGIGRHLGVREKAARSTAFYVTQTCDLGDAAKVWEGLRECPAVMPAQRCMWWQTWVNRQRLPLSGEIAERVLKEIQEIRSTAL